MRRRIVALLGLVATAPVASAHEAAGAVTTAPSAGELWIVAAGASLVMAITFAAIAAFLWRSIWKGRQLTSNPLLTGVTLIFTTCAIGHFLHFEHTILPIYAPAASAWLGLGDAAHAVGFGHWARIAMVHPLLLATDIATAGIAVWYFTLRRRQRDVLRGAELADDLGVREQEARMMQDSVVQTVVEAKLLLETGRREEAVETIQDAIDESQEIVDTFLDTASDVQPGELRRSEATGG